MKHQNSIQNLQRGGSIIDVGNFSFEASPTFGKKLPIYNPKTISQKFHKNNAGSSNQSKKQQRMRNFQRLISRDSNLGGSFYGLAQFNNNGIKQRIRSPNYKKDMFAMS